MIAELLDVVALLLLAAGARVCARCGHISAMHMGACIRLGCSCRGFVGRRRCEIVHTPRGLPN